MPWLGLWPGLCKHHPLCRSSSLPTVKSPSGRPLDDMVPPPNSGLPASAGRCTRRFTQHIRILAPTFHMCVHMPVTRPTSLSIQLQSLCVVRPRHFKAAARICRGLRAGVAPHNCLGSGFPSRPLAPLLHGQRLRGVGSRTGTVVPALRCLQRRHVELTLVLLLKPLTLHRYAAFRPSCVSSLLMSSPLLPILLNRALSWARSFST